MNTTLYQNRPEHTQNWTNLYLEPHDCRIYYVNINLRHQYRISATESQAFLRAKRPQRRGARRNGCFRRLLERHLGKNFSPRTRLNPPLQILTIWHVYARWARGSGQIEVFKKMPQALPFSLPAVLRSLTFSLLPYFFRFSFAFFAHLHWLTECLAQPTVNLNQKSRIPLQFDLDWQ